MNNLQKICIALGTLGIAMLCIRVPYQTEFSGDSSAINEGYSFVWSPPDSARSCIKNGQLQGFEARFGGLDNQSRLQVARRLCETKPKFVQIALSATAVALTTIAIWLLLGISKRVTTSGSQFPTQSAATSADPLRMNRNKSKSTPSDALDLPMPLLADLLREHLDPELPVSTGNGKEDDPLIITATRDYVSVEYAIAHHALAMSNEEFKLNEQRLHNRGDRVIDELVFDVKPSGASAWKGQRRFFFDITTGFGIT